LIDVSQILVLKGEGSKSSSNVRNLNASNSSLNLSQKWRKRAEKRDFQGLALRVDSFEKRIEDSLRLTN